MNKKFLQVIQWAGSLIIPLVNEDETASGNYITSSDDGETWEAWEFPLDDTKWSMGACTGGLIAVPFSEVEEGAGNPIYLSEDGMTWMETGETAPPEESYVVDNGTYCTIHSMNESYSDIITDGNYWEAFDCLSTEPCTCHTYGEVDGDTVDLYVIGTVGGTFTLYKVLIYTEGSTIEREVEEYELPELSENEIWTGIALKDGIVYLSSGYTDDNWADIHVAVSNDSWTDWTVNSLGSSAADYWISSHLVANESTIFAVADNWDEFIDYSPSKPYIPYAKTTNGISWELDKAYIDEAGENITGLPQVYPRLLTCTFDSKPMIFFSYDSNGTASYKFLSFTEGTNPVIKVTQNDEDVADKLRTATKMLYKGTIASDKVTFTQSSLTLPQAGMKICAGTMGNQSIIVAWKANDSVFFHSEDNGITWTPYYTSTVISNILHHNGYWVIQYSSGYYVTVFYRTFDNSVDLYATPSTIWSVNICNTYLLVYSGTSFVLLSYVRWENIFVNQEFDGNTDTGFMESATIAESETSLYIHNSNMDDSVFYADKNDLDTAEYLEHPGQWMPSVCTYYKGKYYIFEAGDGEPPKMYTSTDAHTWSTPISLPWDSDTIPGNIVTTSNGIFVIPAISEEPSL